LAAPVPGFCPGIRTGVVDFVTYWKKRYGRVNELNARIPWDRGRCRNSRMPFGFTLPSATLLPHDKAPCNRDGCTGLSGGGGGHLWWSSAPSSMVSRVGGAGHWTTK